jgi:hypothetical protein
LWLLFRNKLLTRDNISKRKHLDDDSCLLCTEREIACHFYFLNVC